MKKIALVFTLFMGVVFSSQAQDQKVKVDAKDQTVKVKTSGTKTETISYEAVADKETEKLDKIVKLTPEQRTAINSINLSLARRQEIVNTNSAPNKQELLQQLENARMNMYLQKLTDEQAAKYKASMQSK
jgi:hypothetical protein